MKIRTGKIGALLLVNPSHPIPDHAAPDLVCVDPRWPEVKLERRAAGLLNACIRFVGGEELIVPVSGWRSREEQQAIWDDTMAREGEAFTQAYVARPGCSEHQTGLAIDLGAAAERIDFIRPEFPSHGVCGAFRQRAADYGFILRYPAGKESITGIAHEPWHFRYVGVPHAGIMADLGLCLEEYIVLLRRDYIRRPLTVQTGSRTFRIRYCSGLEGADIYTDHGSCQQVSEDNCGGVIVTTWG